MWLSSPSVSLCGKSTVDSLLSLAQIQITHMQKVLGNMRQTALACQFLSLLSFFLSSLSLSLSLYTCLRLQWAKFNLYIPLGAGKIRMLAWRGQVRGGGCLSPFSASEGSCTVHWASTWILRQKQEWINEKRSWNNLNSINENKASMQSIPWTQKPTHKKKPSGNEL